MGFLQVLLYFRKIRIPAETLYDDGLCKKRRLYFLNGEFKILEYDFNPFGRFETKRPVIQVPGSNDKRSSNRFIILSAI
ncbi:hypothetical protein DLM76_06700 [Leptospira yasudae]|nr:hypothetical protein DLM76_06700 [Leptospira yasudae]